MRRLHLIFLPITAAVTVLALLRGGWSCGVDAPFHLQSWIDASQQLRHGVLYPRWTFDAAYNAGEPRFTFYPPLSWMVGGWLALLLPIALVPKVFVWAVLTIAGLTMYRAAAPWTSPGGALLAACVYLANPFMLFSVVTRAAYGELFAAAWCPLLFAALLAEELSAWRLGVPLALVWLSNVPAAVLAMYFVALLAAVRLVLDWQRGRGGPLPARGAAIAREAITVAGGYAYGLALAAVFLVPAIAERRWIHMADAYTPGMRPYDNLLPLRGFEGLEDLFLVHVGHIVLGLGVMTLAALAVAWWRDRSLPGLNEARNLPLMMVTMAVLFLVITPSAPLWKHLPELWVAQFPWRTLLFLGCCLGLALASALRATRLRQSVTVTVSISWVAALGLLCGVAFRHGCDASDQPQAILAGLQRHHTPEPTDEYVPAAAEAETMRPDDPPFWLTQDPQSFVAGTTPNLTGTDPSAPMPAVPAGARLAATPLHFHVFSRDSSFLVVNLQGYPKWRVWRNGEPVRELRHRPDGLLAFPVPPGASEVEIAWHHTADEWLGAALSLVALGLGLRSRVRWLA